MLEHHRVELQYSSLFDILFDGLYTTQVILYLICYLIAMHILNKQYFDLTKINL
jgi:hypothetical protein